MKIFHVYHEEYWIGSFLQASFSTKENAEAYIKNNPNKYDESELCIVEYTLDSEMPIK
ncbi:hypothetical protein [Caudoviricetes sp.]|nr:hypothetical protein [Caudoviricetes sp.]